ncbi:hypothetical protein EXIGLDRAFT_720198, partial [Exidia glandulosa HHB12029]
MPELPEEWSSGVVRCLKEMDADDESQLCWVLLLAFSLAVLGEGATGALHKLPLLVKMEIIAVIPPTAHSATIVEFTLEVIEEAIQEMWEGKRKILSLQHGWV